MSGEIVSVEPASLRPVAGESSDRLGFGQVMTNPYTVADP
jgi:hypothetical protein